MFNIQGDYLLYQILKFNAIEITFPIFYSKLFKQKGREAKMF